MSVAASLAFPGGRTLAAWWRQLAGHAPEALWAGYLTFHRVDCPVLASHPHRLAPFEALVLKAAAACKAPAASTDLARWLHLDPAIIQRVLEYLAGEGLVALPGGGTVSITEIGKIASAHGDYSKNRRERRTLQFWHADWAAPGSSLFVHLQLADRIAWLPAPETTFLAEQLQNCVQQGQDWKKRHAFPAAITEVLTTPAGTAPNGPEQVMVVTPLRCFATAALTRGLEGSALIGFTVNTVNWEMNATLQAFRVPLEPQGWFPPVIPEAALRMAFVDWCQQRQFPLEVAQQCNLRIEGGRLIVESTPEVREKMRGVRGESWLLAGSGLLRAALRLEFP